MQRCRLLTNYASYAHSTDEKSPQQVSLGAHPVYKTPDAVYKTNVERITGPVADSDFTAPPPSSYSYRFCTTSCSSYADAPGQQPHVLAGISGGKQKERDVTRERSSHSSLSLSSSKPRVAHNKCCLVM